MSLDAGSRLDGPSQDQNRKSHIDFGAIRGDADVRAAAFSGIVRKTSEAATPNTIGSNDLAALSGPPQKEPLTDRQPPLPSPASLLRSEFDPGSVTRESPWKTYRKGFELKLDQFVTVAVRQGPQSGKVAIKEYSDRDAGRMLEMLHKVRHERFAKFLDVFQHRDMCYAIFEHVLVSLTEVVACPAYPTEQQLIAILAQEYCLTAAGSDTADVRAVGNIAMNLMQKYAKDDGAISIENFNRWPPNSTPVKVLTTTNSARSVTELEQHALFQHFWRKEDLELLAELASFTPRRSYNYVLRRHALIGPWTAITVLAVMICVAINIVCLTLGTADWSQAARRAGTLSIINLGALYSGLHLNFLASLLGFSLGTLRIIHRSASLIALSLAGFHIVVGAVTDKSAFQRAALKPSALIRPSYEVFLRLHQVVALACACAIWRHIRSRDFSRVVLYIFSGLLGITFIGETGVVIFRNGCSYRRGSRVTITSTCGMVQLKVHLAKPLQIEPGQFLNLWMPSVSLGACMRSHPFLVTSWSAEPQRTLDIFVQPRRGMTRDLHHLTRQGAVLENRWVVFGGPYGQTIPAGQYEKVVMVADGVGIAVQLPYLQKLIHGYHARQAFTRRIHLIWQVILTNPAVGIAAQPLLNNALDEDKLGSGGILQISIFVDAQEVSTMAFGNRSTIYPGTADLDHLVGSELPPANKVEETATVPTARFSFPSESHRPRPRTDHARTLIQLQDWNSKTSTRARDSVTSKYTMDDANSPNAPGPGRRVAGAIDGRTAAEDRMLEMRPTFQGMTLILVSGFGTTRDTLRKLVRQHLTDKVELAELEFQPFQN
ncbi:hypothetical protein LTR06_011211 [Exophiala xenobiotica]|nr:hypothetical protein LTR06_011211 [Exophiala xenobiotica]